MKTQRNILGVAVETRTISPMVASTPFRSISSAASSKRRSTRTVKEYRIANSAHPDNVWRDYADMKFVIEDFQRKNDRSIYKDIFNP